MRKQTNQPTNQPTNEDKSKHSSSRSKLFYVICAFSLTTEGLSLDGMVSPLSYVISVCSTDTSWASMQGALFAREAPANLPHH